VGRIADRDSETGVDGNNFDRDRECGLKFFIRDRKCVYIFLIAIMIAYEIFHSRSQVRLYLFDRYHDRV